MIQITDISISALFYTHDHNVCGLNRDISSSALLAKIINDVCVKSECKNCILNTYKDYCLSVYLRRFVWRKWL